MTVPDTITTWIADAFAMSNTAAFGMTDVPSRLVAFKPFFISLSLPYSVVRREEVEIIATVFNYYYEDLKVKVKCPQQRRNRSDRQVVSVQCTDTDTSVAVACLQTDMLKLCTYSIVDGLSGGAYICN